MLGPQLFIGCQISSSDEGLHSQKFVNKNAIVKDYHNHSPTGSKTLLQSFDTSSKNGSSIDFPKNLKSNAGVKKMPVEITIHAVPPVTSGNGRRHLNQEYRRDNFPGLYVGRRRFKSANDLFKSKLIRKKKQTVQDFVNGLYESYFQQETPGPVDDTLEGVTVVCKLPGMPS